MTPREYAGWLADKIPAYGDYAKEAASVLIRQADEIDELRAFAQAVMGYWPEGSPDGGDLQELAEKHGLLKPETRHEPCGQECPCAEDADEGEWVAGVMCYRRTPLLMGSNAEIRGGEAVPLD